jgi:hypothetical protein
VSLGRRALRVVVDPFRPYSTFFKLLDAHRQRAIDDCRFVGAPVGVPQQILRAAVLRAGLPDPIG